MRLVWWTCALLSLGVARARIYRRCELARDLTALGVHADHLSTWVCIAYHESRFDTAANNPHSGDHGIFQISELYWCGPGKACGLPCTALRDEDISDDFECALQVHEEHTRLQGDGFLAWVVYPHHCKQNTKKYLADCDTFPKNVTFQSERRSFNTYQNNNYKPKNDFYAPYPNIDNFLPPYLTISSIFRGSYGKMLDHNKIDGVDWYNYKYDKVDELKLPAVDKNDKVDKFKLPVTLNNDKVDQLRPPVIPKNNKVDEFQLPFYFDKTKAHKALTFADFIVSAAAPGPNPVVTNAVPTATAVAQQITTSRSTVAPTTTTTYVPPVKPWRYIESNDFRKKVTVSDTTATTTTTTTTRKPYYDTFPTEKFTISSTTTKQPTTKSTTYKSRTSVTRTNITTKVKSTTASYKSQTTPVSTVKPVNITYTAYKWPTFMTSYKPRTGETPTTSKVTIKTNNDVFRSFSATTLRPFTAVTPWWLTTAKVSSTGLSTTTTAPTRRNWYTFTSRYTNTKLPTTTYRSYVPTTTYRSYVPTTTVQSTRFERTSQTSLRTTPKSFIRTTDRPIRLTERTTTVRTPRVTSRVPRVFSTVAPTATTKPASTSRSTQSIFDLYLNPTKPPRLPISFSRGTNKYRLNIFSGGTTHAPLGKLETDTKRNL